MRDNLGELGRGHEGATMRSRPPTRKKSPGSQKDLTGVYSLPPGAPEATLSSSLWGEECFSHLPLTLEGRKTMSAVRGDWNQALEFLARFPQLREETQDRAISQNMAYAKRRYLRTYCDLLELRCDGETVGLFIGAPEDWSTYYCRILAFDPQRTARPLIRKLFNACLIDPLTRLGVERLVGDTAPTNAIMNRWFMDLGFQITGQKLTERWGPFVQFTKFLGTQQQQAFSRRFGQNAQVGANDNHVAAATE